MYTDHTADDALEAGADAFQLKGKPAEDLLDAILA
jgi:DNA-binding NarL/FixJ family response regulator